MAAITITRDGLRGHLRAIQLAGAGSLFFGACASWAQTPYPGTALPLCEVFPPGGAPAIGPSNCMPAPAALWAAATPAADLSSRGQSTDPAAPTRPLPVDDHPAPAVPAPKPAAPPVSSSSSPPEQAVAPKPPAPQAVVALRTQGAVTLDQIAAQLGPVSRRTVTLALTSADAYKKGDLTHRVRLAWSGPLQALVDQLGDIYGLSVAIDDTDIRFSSRQADRTDGGSIIRTP